VKLIHKQTGGHQMHLIDPLNLLDILAGHFHFDQSGIITADWNTRSSIFCSYLNATWPPSSVEWWKHWAQPVSRWTDSVCCIFIYQTGWWVSSILFYSFQSCMI